MNLGLPSKLKYMDEVLIAYEHKPIKLLLFGGNPLMPDKGCELNIV